MSKARRRVELAFDQSDRDALLLGPLGPVRSYRPTGRILARRIGRPFTLETAHGRVQGAAGDYVATAHPDDDPGADMWLVSAERMASHAED